MLDGMTPLMHAARSLEGGKALEWLLEQGVDPEQKDFEHMTALCHAVVACNLPAVQALIKEGCEVDVRMASVGRWVTGTTPFIAAIACAAATSDSRREAYLVVADQLVMAGADVNACDGVGRQAITYVTMTNNIESVKSVLARYDILPQDDVAKVTLNSLVLEMHAPGQDVVCVEAGLLRGQMAQVRKEMIEQREREAAEKLAAGEEVEQEEAPYRIEAGL